MPLAPCNGVPSSFVQGDSLSFTYADPNFPSSAWRMSLALLRSEGATAPIVGTPVNDDSFAFALSSADSGLILPGRYSGRLVATATGQRQSLWSSSIFVYPDPTVALVPTWAMSTLAALRKGYGGLVGGTIQTFSGGGQSWTKKNLAELQQAIDRMYVIVQAELRELGLPYKGGQVNIVTRFC